MTTRLEKNYTLVKHLDVLNVDCPTCGAVGDPEAHEYCSTKSGAVALEPHAARRDATSFSVGEPVKHNVDAESIDFLINKSKMQQKKIARREAIIKRMLVKLREHYTDEYIMWELMFKEDEV